MLLLPGYSQQQQADKAGQPSTTVAAAKEGKASMSTRGRILGIGGIFFKSANKEQMRKWYGDHLGLVDKGGGAMLPWRGKGPP
ncbi:MAG: hypothetical protein QM757_29405 [Paludibaculum sp.]